MTITTTVDVSEFKAAGFDRSRRLAGGRVTVACSRCRAHIAAGWLATHEAGCANTVFDDFVNLTCPVCGTDFYGAACPEGCSPDPVTVARLAARGWK